MERNFEIFGAKDLIRLKGNCPSGYPCRTRHPQGPVILSAWYFEKSGGLDL